MNQKLTKEELAEKIKSWEKRAAMARKQGYDDLEKQALEYKRNFENELARRQEQEPEQSV